jgi:hypothetical protein
MRAINAEYVWRRWQTAEKRFDLWEKQKSSFVPEQLPVLVALAQAFASLRMTVWVHATKLWDATLGLVS